MRDPVEPRPYVGGVVAAHERGVRVDEGLLGGVLGARLGKDARAVAHELAAVAVDENVERALVAVAHEPGQALIRLAGEHRASGQACRG